VRACVRVCVSVRVRIGFWRYITFWSNHENNTLQPPNCSSHILHTRTYVGLKITYITDTTKIHNKFTKLASNSTPSAAGTLISALCRGVDC